MDDYKNTIIKLVQEAEDLDILKSVYTMLTVYKKLQETNLNYTPQK